MAHEETLRMSAANKNAFKEIVVETSWPQLEGRTGCCDQRTFAPATTDVWPSRTRAEPSAVAMLPVK
jgi:hypothetical protein